jgi:hypothetical protein
VDLRQPQNLLEMRSAGIALGVAGGVGQLAVAFMGYAIGGASPSVVLLAINGLVAIVGAVALARWVFPGAALLFLTGLAAAVAVLSTTLLEIAVATLLLVAAAVTLVAARSARA